MEILPDVGSIDLPFMCKNAKLLIDNNVYSKLDILFE